EKEVRRIVRDDPSALNRRMSRNENHRTPLQFAVRMNLQDMVALLLDLGADPLAVDGFGQTTATYAESGNVDRKVMERIRAMTLAEIDSAERGKRAIRATTMDVLAALALRDLQTAERLVSADASIIGPRSGALHLAAKRGDVSAVHWLIDHGADVNA